MTINWNEAPEWADKVILFIHDERLSDYAWSNGSIFRYFRTNTDRKMSDNTSRFKVLETRPVDKPSSDGIKKQERYLKQNGMDKIDQWARDKTHEQFRTIMWAMCEKYESRLGKKDKIINEVEKMADYMNRWLAYEKKWSKEDACNPLEQNDIS